MSIKIKRSSNSYKWEGDVPLLFVSEEEINLLTEYLAEQIIKADYNPQLIISIAQSGMMLGEILAKIFDIPHAIFRTQSYNSNSSKNVKKETKVHHVLIAQNSLLIDINHQLTELPINFTTYYTRVMVIDDLINSGDSIQTVINQIQKKHVGNYYIQTACLWLKSCSAYKPNYYGTLVEPEPESGKIPWIVQPKDVLIYELRKKFIAVN